MEAPLLDKLLLNKTTREDSENRVLKVWIDGVVETYYLVGNFRIFNRVSIDHEFKISFVEIAYESVSRYDYNANNYLEHKIVDEVKRLIR